jgi:D-threo-aldose 1-dehydrogenase
MALPTTRFGRSGLMVTRLGLGSAPIGNRSDPADADQLIATVRAALKQGINLIDTAPLYGAGYAEQLLGQALAGVPRDSYILSTKVGRLVHADGSVHFNFSREAVLRSLEESLKRLGLDRVDIALIHDPDNHAEQAFRETFPALAELRAQGVVRAIGAGMNQWEMEQRFIKEADPDVFLLAGRYTLLEQTSLDFLELCRTRDVGIMLGGVYNSGILATGVKGGGNYNYAPPPPEIAEKANKIETICGSHGVPLHVAAVRFAAAHPAVCSLVLGAVAPAEVNANVAALSTPVPAELWHELREAGLIEAGAPLPV